MRLALTAAAAALASLPAYSAEKAADPVKLDPVVIVGTRTAEPVNRLPAAVTVITRSQIEASGARQIVEVLRLAGALQVSDFYGDGSRAQLDIRGFGDASHSSTLVLVDGRRLNNTDIAPPDLSTIALQDVERIEIIEGGAGTLYGDQAIGGVINIVTRAPQSLSGAASLEGGSGALWGARASLAQRWDAASLRISGEGVRTDNYRAHNERTAQNFLARAGYDGGDAGMSVEAGYTAEALNTPGPLFAAQMASDRRQVSSAFKNDFADTKSGFVRVNGHGALSEHWNLEADLDHRATRGEFRLSFASGFSATGIQDRDLRAMHPRLVGRLGETLVTLGADGLLGDYELNSTAFGLQTNKQKMGELYAQVITPVATNLELTAGAHYAKVSNELRDGFTFTTPTTVRDSEPAGELGLTWRPVAALKLYTRYDRTFRFPKVDEYTQACAGAILDTQSGHSLEAGAEHVVGALSLRASAYRLELENEIAFDPLSCGYGTNVNLDRTRRDGVGLSGALALADGVSLDASVHHLDSEVTGGSLTGREIPLASRNTAKLGLNAGAFGVVTHLEVQGVDSRPVAGDFSNSLERLPGYAVVNSAFTWERAGWRVTARANNLLDHRYAEYGAAAYDATFTQAAAYFPSPERNFRLSVERRW